MQKYFYECRALVKVATVWVKEEEGRFQQVFLLITSKSIARKGRNKLSNITCSHDMGECLPAKPHGVSSKSNPTRRDAFKLGRTRIASVGAFSRRPRMFSCTDGKK